MSLARRIEEYIKRLLELQNAVEIQRSELADHFQCVPSQINYVLGTRFTPSQGYLVESRRGGGGYLRIIKLSWENQPQAHVKKLYHSLGVEIDQREAEGILKHLSEEQIISTREYQILKAVINRNTLQIDLPERDYLRAKIIQAVLTAICRNDLGREC